MHTDTTNRIRQIQQQLEADDLTPEEAEALMAELEELKGKLHEWEGKKAELEQLLTGSDTTLKDRGSQRRLHFSSEIQALTGTLGRTATLLQQKQGRLDEISAQWDDLEQREKELMGQLSHTQIQLNQQRLPETSVKGVNQLSEQIKTIQQDLDADYSPKLQEFQELARNLMAADKTKAPRAQKCLENVDAEWETVHEALGDKFATCNKVSATWKQYNDAQGAVSKALQRVGQTLDDKQGLSSQQQVRRALDRCKVGAKKHHLFHVLWNDVRCHLSNHTNLFLVLV